MARSKAKLPSPFTGLWHIISMENWDDDFLNEEIQAFIEFEASGAGQFQFGYDSGNVDWRSTTRDGEPAIKWSWEGGDGADGTPLSGRGWTKLKDDERHGMFFIHLGDASSFVATRAKAPQRRKRK